MTPEIPNTINKKDEDAFEKEYEIKSLKRTLQDGDASELLSVSFYTRIGFLSVVAALFIWIFFDLSIQIGVGVITIAGLIFLLGFILDILRWRDYSEWGALGAIISYSGVFLILLPLILNMLFYIDESIFFFLDKENLLVPLLETYNISWYEISIVLIGPCLVIIGFTSRATELDDKIVELVSNLLAGKR